MLVWLLLSTAAGQLSNDVCLGATNVSTGVTAGLNNYASILVDSQSTCIPARDVYYVYYPTCTGMATISVTPANSSYYLAVGVFLGRSCAALGACTYESGYSGTQEVSTSVFGAGDKVYFAVGNEDSNDPPTVYTVNITCTTAPVAQGDICSQAIPITGNNTQMNVSSLDASPDSQGSCSYPDIWLVYNASCTGDATFSALTGSGYGRVQTFFDGGCDRILSGYWDIGCGSSGDSETVSVIAGRLYYIAIGYGNTGEFYNVTVTCMAAAHPANDRCEGATTASNVISTVNATQSIPSQLCGSSRGSNDVWVTYTATCTGDVTVMFNQSYVTAVAFVGPCGTYMLASECVYDGDFTFPVINGTVYTVNFGYEGDVAIGLNWTCTPSARPTNDWCANPIDVTANSSQTVNMTLATTDNYQVCDGDLKKDVYFRYTTCYGLNTISAIGIGTYQTSPQVAGFLACGLAPLLCADLPYTFFAPAVVQVTLGFGWTYATESGQVQVNFTCIPSPSSAPTTAPPSLAPTKAPTPVGTTLAPTMSNSSNSTTTDAPTAGNVGGAAVAQLGLATLVFCAFAA